MKKNSKKQKGFTFIEVLIAVFVFVLMMTTLTGIFGRSLTGYKKAVRVQKDLELAQQAMNIMAKTFRTSGITSIASSDTIRVFDFSQSECIEYEFSGNVLQVRSEGDPGNVLAPNKMKWCDELPSFGNDRILVPETVTGVFDSVTPTLTDAGRVTVSMTVCPLDGCTANPADRAVIQTSVTLRNKYGEVYP
jgi:prepilin-type N-terminal cleavage/methylation domain-containing protein